MKKIIFSIVLLMATISSIQAQTTKSRLSEEQKKELQAKMEAHRAKLNLSDDQQSKVEEINADYIEALSKIKESGGSQMQRYKKLKQANTNRDKKMKEILTSEQYKMYKEQQEELKKEVKKSRRARR